MIASHTSALTRAQQTGAPAGQLGVHHTATDDRTVGEVATDVIVCTGWL
jgi:hypothetical protein